jgi:hypothetical protein
MAVGQGAFDPEGVGGEEGFTPEEASEEIDLGGGPMGEVGEGAFDDAIALAGARAEEDGGRGVAVGDGLDVHGNMV